MPQPISDAELRIYQQQAKAGGVEKVAELYKVLDNLGYDYSGWARGVVTQQTISGYAATNFLESTALMGLGGDQCRNIGTSTMNNIKVDMFMAYTDQLIKISQATGGIVKRDIDFSEGQYIHGVVFPKYGLDLNNWTLYKPMQIIANVFGQAEAERVWQKMMATEGAGSDALVENFRLLTTIVKISNSAEVSAENKALAHDWLKQELQPAGINGLEKVIDNPGILKDLINDSGFLKMFKIVSISSHGFGEIEAYQLANQIYPSSWLVAGSTDGIGVDINESNRNRLTDLLKYNLNGVSGAIQISQISSKGEFVVHSSESNITLLIGKDSCFKQVQVNATTIQQSVCSMKGEPTQVNTLINKGNGQWTSLNDSNGDGMLDYGDNVLVTNGTETNDFIMEVSSSNPSSVDRSDGWLIGDINYNISAPVTALDYNYNTDLGTYTFNSTATRELTDYLRNYDGNIAQYTLNPTQYNSTVTLSSNIVDKTLAIYFNNASTNSSSYRQMTDPLVLDLNGDGVKLTQFLDDPVLFDIDNDGGSLEQTGWVSKEDGIVVVDLNSNGKIDNISETLSEYYKGAKGTDGSAGIKNFKDGFAALKSLDSNNDNLFNVSDAAWSSVKVWVDDNHDGISFKDLNKNGLVDAGETELKTLTQLGITQISLVNQVQSGEVRDGNEVLSRGTFTQSGVVKEALAVNFLANPNGGVVTNTTTGTVMTSDGSIGATHVKSYVTTSTTGESINVAIKGVNNASGGRGNDILIGDATNNWLAGGVGSDTFNAGAGNDVLLIDADDLEANIHAGAGDDIIQVVGDRGVTLNMAQIEAEVVQGGRGADVIIAGGRNTVFVRGDDGDDMLIGGSANDVLNGENGRDLVNGGDGNDVLRGHRDNDTIMGGQGNDYLDGGLDDDKMLGGDGEDVIIAGAGDDTIDGGAGVDAISFRGKISEYSFMRTEDGVWVSDRVAGRDGTDFIKNVEKANFSDLKLMDIPSKTSPGFTFPIPADDVLLVNKSGGTLNRTQAQLIGKEQLLGNDVNWGNNPLHVQELFDITGGTASFTADGDVLFTPDANFTGFMGFKYKIQDSAGQFVLINGVQGSGEVKLQTSDLPTDTLVTQQEYLVDANILPVWKDYSGKGIQVGVFEIAGPFANTPQVFNYTHPDLMANLDKKWLANPTAGERAGEGDEGNYSWHATMVAGVIASTNNGSGNVGVAYNASLSGYWLGGFSDISNYKYLKNYDVVNQSWMEPSNLSYSMGLSGFFVGYVDAVSLGRGGLGTVLVNAAGNDRAKGANTSDSVLTNNRAAIVVAGVDLQDAQTLTAKGLGQYSTQGANLLVTAASEHLSTTGLQVENINGSVFGHEETSVSGTSFAAPTVSGIVALMLEANPNLGYRDVQEILAASARKITDSNTVWQTNSAGNWNGGGMHVSHDYGYGMVDARAAVRLAETWIKQETSQNEASLTNAISSGISNVAIPDNNGQLLVSTLKVNVPNFVLESVAVEIKLTHANAGDLIIKLISPSGTESVLMDRKGVSETNLTGDKSFDGGTSNTLSYVFNSSLLRGESITGDWKLQVQDARTGNIGVFQSWSLNFFGSANGINDQYIYTNEFGQLGTGTRAILNDTDGGRDTINVAAVSSATTVNLSTGTASIAGKALTITNPSSIENILGGEFNDTLVGNSAQNFLSGGRGNDILNGQAGNDTLDGYWNSDTYIGGAGADLFVIRKDTTSKDVVTDFSVATANEKIALVGFGALNFTSMLKTQIGTDVQLDLGGGQTLLLKNMTLSQLNAGYFVFASNQQGLQTWQVNNASAVGAPANVLNTFAPSKPADPVIKGTSAADKLTGDAGGNTIDGLVGADTMEGRTGNDTYIVDNIGDKIIELDGGGFDSVKSSVSYTLANEVENITLTGTAAINATGNGLANRLMGNVGNNILDGGIGKDIMSGGTGNDTYVVDDSADAITELANQGVDQVNASASFTLGNHIENLTLTGTNDISGTGNDLNNILIGNSGRNRLIGWMGDDTFTGGKGSDDLLDNAGNDTYVFNLNDGLDSITDLAGVDTLQLKFVSTSLRSATKEGNNLIINYGVSDTLMIKGFFSGQLIEKVQFSDNIIRTLRFGSDANDAYTILDGRQGDNFLLGLNGDDTYAVDNINDVVVDGLNAGNDTILLTNGNIVNYTVSTNIETVDAVNKTDAAVNITGNTLNNTLYGNTFANTLKGLTGNDKLFGVKGDDVLMGGLGNDTLDGGEGVDRADYSDMTASISINLNLTTEQNTQAGGLDTLTNIENVTGGTGNDTIVGNALSNNLVGLGGNDTLDGGEGNDTLDGGTGTDKLIGGAGNDIYVVDNTGDVVTENLNAGTDRVNSSVGYTLGSNVEVLQLTGTSNINGTGNSLNNTVYASAGNNILDGGAGADSLSYYYAASAVQVSLASTAAQTTGGSGSDTILNFENLYGSAYNDKLTGNAANNLLSGGAGADTLIGGTGNDTYVVDNTGDVVTETATTDTADVVQSSVTYTLGTNLENLTLTGASAINGTGNTANNVITGNAANNVLSGGAGADTLIGGAGNDIYVVDNTGDVVTETATTDTADVVQSSITYTLGTNLENLTLTGASAINGTGNTVNNVITGNAANNVLDGGIGSDTLIGGAGNDIYVVDDIGDVVTETTTTDTTDVVQSSVTYTLGTNLENLTLTGASAINGTGNTANNVITGNAANNVLSGGAGADTLIGGAGNDIYVVDNTGDVVTETATTDTADVVQSSITYTLGTNLENLTLTGTSAINGTGNTANNVITGNAANNVLNGGVGADTLVGGAGSDTYVVDNAGDVVTENLNEGTDRVNSSVSYTLGSNVEILQLTGTSNINGTCNDLNNSIYTSVGNNILDGGAGVDSLCYNYAASAVQVSLASTVAQTTGGSGSDTILNFENLYGSVYNDTLTGSALDNLINGQSGNDIINGGLGNDTLYGGQGQDTFVLSAGLNASTNKDTIADFVAIDDVIHLENSIFTKLSAVGTLDINFFKSNSNGTAEDANDYILYNSTTGALSYDADGNGVGGAIAFAVLGASTHPTINYMDFVVI